MQITANGIRINYLLEGPASAPVVTLAHSLAASLSMWDPQASALASRYRVLRYDMRGHGATEVTAGPYSLDLLAEDVRALLGALGIARTHFVGLSIGGMIGQTLALARPELFASLTLCDTTSRTPAEAHAVWDERIRTVETEGIAPLVESTLGRWFTAPFRERRPDVADRVRGMIRATDPRGYAGCGHAIRALDLTDRLGALRLPTLVVVGEDDPSTPVAASRAIHERIEGSELVVIPGAAHLANLEQPEAFDRAVMGFLARVSG